MNEAAVRQLFDRMIRAARLEESVYEELEADKKATLSAGIVVAGTSVLAGIGAAFEFGLLGILVVALAALGAWWLYAWLTYVIGTKLLKGPDTKADQAELARVLGFANTPRALLIVGGASPLIAFGILLWVFAATVVARRAALDFSTARAIATAIAGSIAHYIVVQLAFALYG